VESGVPNSCVLRISASGFFMTLLLPEEEDQDGSCIWDLAIGTLLEAACEKC